ncbi:MAG: Ribonuclease HII, partial [uncultured Ramlibacter sp.]
ARTGSAGLGSAGPDGRCRRGRPRAARRAGGGSRRHPGRHQAHPRPRRFEGADTAAARPPVRPDPRQGPVLLGRRGHRGGDRHAQHPARHDAGDEACRRRAAAEARQGAGGRQPAAPDRRTGRGRRGRRRQGQVDLRRVDPGQGASRPVVQDAGRRVPAVRLRRPQGLQHAGTPGGAARARCLPTPPQVLQPGGGHHDAGRGRGRHHHRAV